MLSGETLQELIADVMMKSADEAEMNRIIANVGAEKRRVLTARK